MEVHIRPMPIAYRKYGRFKPRHPAVFVGEGNPTHDDRELALELWRSLDAHSKRWYTYDGTAREFVGLPLTAADIAGMRET